MARARRSFLAGLLCHVARSPCLCNRQLWRAALFFHGLVGTRKAADDACVARDECSYGNDIYPPLFRGIQHSEMAGAGNLYPGVGISRLLACLCCLRARLCATTGPDLRLHVHAFAGNRYLLRYSRIPSTRSLFGLFSCGLVGSRNCDCRPRIIWIGTASLSHTHRKQYVDGAGG